MIRRRTTLTGLLGAGFAAPLVPLARAIAAPGQESLGSNRNYALYDASNGSCGDLSGVSVTIDVTQAVVCKSATGPARGFNFQLNAYSDQANAAWQQYIIGLRGTDLHGRVNNFRSTGPDVRLMPTVRQDFSLLSMPDVTVPAGDVMTISPLNDRNNAIDGVDFVIRNEGRMLAQKHVNLLDIGLTQADLAQIVAFEMVLVGPQGGNTAMLSSGAGTFAFSAASALTAQLGLPPCVAHRNGTAERANSVYGALPAGPGTRIAQSFGVAA